jgi:hypothetical protein
MRIVGFKGFAQVETNTASAAAMRRFADQLRHARATNPTSSLLRTMDELRQRATGEAQQPPSSFAHLFDPDLERRLTSDVVTNDSVEDVKPVKPAKQTRKRKPTLAGVARQAANAGIPVAGYEVRSDGSIRIITGKPVRGGEIEMDDTTPIDPSEWN